MKEEDLNKLRRDLKDLAAKVELIIHEKENDPFSQNLKKFAQAISEDFGEKITLTEKDKSFDLPGLPALTLACENRRNIHYLTVPEGYELHPFTQALKFIAQGHAPLSTPTKKVLDRISHPAEIWVLVSPYCTNCPKVVETVIALASTNPLISTFIIDVQYFKELADEYDIKSVPATIIDQQLVLIGQVTQEKLSELLAQRGTLNYDRELIRSLIERGQISRAADLICKGKGREAILSLFEEGDLSMRMGVLVVFEEALENGPGAVRGMVPQLIELLSHEDGRIRGDIADLLGKIGDPRAIPHLERLAADPDPDVMEASAEALEMLRDH